jgi:hypothetical protein
MSDPVPSIVRIHGIHKPYVPIAEMGEYLDIGWMPLPARVGAAMHPYHLDWAVHLVWPCPCRMVVPVGSVQS